METSRRTLRRTGVARTARASSAYQKFLLSPAIVKANGEINQYPQLVVGPLLYPFQLSVLHLLAIDLTPLVWKLWTSASAYHGSPNAGRAHKGPQCTDLGPDGSA